jgi:lipocalin
MISLPLLMAVAFAASPAAAQFFHRNDCPEITPPTDFDLEEYTRKTWYIQRQQLNTYQSEEFNFCITATYELGRKKWGRDAITVMNIANKGSINTPTAGNGPSLCAYLDDEPAKLKVAPCFLPPIFAGQYWVASLAVDYSWAIVVGGQPDQDGECADENLCTTREAGIIPFLPTLGNGQGLWFLTRDQNASDAILASMEAAAEAAGICTANMLPVVHEGCLYEGVTIK